MLHRHVQLVALELHLLQLFGQAGSFGLPPLLLLLELLALRRCPLQLLRFQRCIHMLRPRGIKSIIIRIKVLKL